MPEISMQSRLDARVRPTDNPVMHQDWRHLLFLHWKYDSQALQKKLPPGLFVDTYEGNAYISLVAFAVENLRVPYFPISLPNMVEVNLRTYVYDASGLPGVWFFSLDLNSSMGVSSARQLFLLPYYYAELSQEKIASEIHIKGLRSENPKASFDFSYAPTNEAYSVAEPGSLEFFLMERYLMFSYGDSGLHRARVHHLPYLINKAHVSHWQSDVFNTHALHIQSESAFAHFSPGVNVDIFSLQQL